MTVCLDRNTGLQLLSVIIRNRLTTLGNYHPNHYFLLAATETLCTHYTHTNTNISELHLTKATSAHGNFLMECCCVCMGVR